MRHVVSGVLMIAILVGLAGFAKWRASSTAEIRMITAEGDGMPIGTLSFKDTPKGLKITPDLKNLPPGQHGFHVHAKGACGAGLKDGVPTAGLGAGGHFDPDNTNIHAGPAGAGHKGDLPVLVVATDGTARQSVMAPRLTRADIIGKAVVIHAGGDNYADQPAPLGGGGARIACGIVR